MKIICWGDYMDDMDHMNNTIGTHAVRKSSVFVLVIGWISAIISLFRVPVIFGVLGVIMGILATKNGSRAGLALIMASIALMAVGLIFSGVFYNYLSHFLGFY
jgi:hypothetical protein